MFHFLQRNGSYLYGNGREGRVLGAHTLYIFSICGLELKFYHLIVPLFFSIIEIIEHIELNFYPVNLSFFSLRESLLYQKLKYFKIIEIKKTI
jgi:hypothetical protein